MILKIVFYTLSLILVTTSLLPLVHNKHWVFRAFEFPRLQKFYLLLINLVLGVLIFETSTLFIGSAGILILLAVYQLYQILPFTILHPKSLEGSKNPENSFKLLISNVFQYNANYDKLKEHIRKIDPDLLLFVETDSNWRDALKPVTNSYPYKLEQPQDNTYGMLFYSKLEMLEPKIRFLIEDEIPSLRTILKLSNGQKISFYGLHPPPPSPTQRIYSRERDYELLLVAREVERRAEPTIVAGDMNDVAWSRTTYKFVEISGLKDPRKGRGIYSTFNANNILMRWPLDHIFCSEEFKLVQMHRLSHVGSDHFPVLIELDVPKEPSDSTQ